MADQNVPRDGNQQASIKIEDSYDCKSYFVHSLQQ